MSNNYLDQNYSFRQAGFLHGPDGVPLDDPAELFHEASKNYPETGRSNAGPAFDEMQKIGEAGLGRPVRVLGSERVDLPDEPLTVGSLANSISHRRSRTPSGAISVSLDEIGTALHYSCRAQSGDGDSTRRPAPSAGALYPLDMYLWLYRCEGLTGLWHYLPDHHSLEVLDRRVEKEDMSSAFMDPDDIDGAAGVFILVGSFWRSRLKYGARGYRFVLFEAGHVFQNAALVLASLGCRGKPVAGGFYDEALNRLVAVDGVEEAVLYVFPFEGARV